MTSDAKIEANRRNAAKSTGPKTAEGKASSKMNALKHGLLSEHMVLKDEDEERLEAFRAGLWQHLQPVGELEELLADRVVATAWRLRRAVRIEGEVLERARGDFLPPKLAAQFGVLPDEDAGYAFLNDARGPQCLGKLLRYEAAIDRAMYKALHELQRVQARRAGEPVPAPVAVDVTVNGGFVSQNRPVPREILDFL